MPKWEDEFEALKRNPTHWNTLSPNMRKSLRTRGLVNKEGQVIKIEPQLPDVWRIQTWVKVGEKEQWLDQVSPIGEKMTYSTSDEAERQARQLSLLNMRAFRVLQHTVAGSFVVYDYGQRYLEDRVTHIRTRIEPAIFTQTEGDDLGQLYQIEARRAYSADVVWEDAAPREYVDIESATTASLEISKANPRREYRIVLAQTRISPAPVVYRSGDAFPDTDFLSVMCSMVNPGDTAEAVFSLLILWKGEKPAHRLIRELSEKVPS